MGADFAPEAIRRYSLFYSVHHHRGYYPEIDKDLVLLDYLRIVDYGDVEVVPEDTEETLRRDTNIGLVAFDAHMDLSQTLECWASVQWVKSFELGMLSPKNFVLIGIRSNVPGDPGGL